DAQMHAQHLAALGASDDSELATMIRSGRFDGDLARVLDELEPVIRRKVEVANPRHIDG
ncbi:MAG: hypothetical protein RLZZ544_734, partial [Actinomycetota bacterium]